MSDAAIALNPYARCPVDDAGRLGALYDNNSQPRNQGDLRTLRTLSEAVGPASGGRWQERRYGDAPWEWCDLLLPAAPARAALLFVHGGRWTQNTSRETAFWAEACNRAGAAFIGLNFQPLHPAGLAAQVDGVAAAVRQALACARELGLERDALCLAGHSSGAHLALASLQADPSLGTAVGRLLLLGGIYDLAPLQRTVHQQALGFSDDDVAQRSPLRALAAPAPAALPATLVAVGGEESSEFIRQARALHWALQWRDRALWHELPGAGHFDAALEFNADDSVLRRFAFGPNV